MERLKVADPRGRNPEGIIEQDALIEAVIGQYAKLAEKTKSLVKDVFVSADVTLGYVITRGSWT